MNNINYDTEIERQAHPENFEDNPIKQEAEECLSILSYAIDDLDKFSVYHNDMFSDEVFEMLKLVDSCKRKLI